MTVASLGSTVLASRAISSVSSATRLLESSSARLASGNRLIRAGDDVGALAVSTGLRAQVSGLRQALSNATQANSLLQVAYGGITQINDILIDMQSLATQANNASLSASDFAFLDTSFQSLRDEIDRIADNTVFGSVTLLDGSATDANLVSSVTTNATAATGSLIFAVNVGAGQTVRLNGVTFTEGTNFTAGGSIPTTLDSLVTALNTSTNTAISQANYQRVGNTITITQKSGGALGNQFIINQAGSTAVFTGSGAATLTANVFSLQGGTDNGLNQSSVTASGTIGDPLVTTQSQVSATSTLTVSGAIANGELIRIDNGAGGFTDFQFTNAPATSKDIQIEATVADTLRNAVGVISRYTSTTGDDFGSRQLDVRRVGDTLVFTNKLVGNALDTTGATLDIAETLGNGSLSNAAFNNGVNTGINVDGVNNADFVGTVSGFTATYNSADNITASITVGSSTYSATITDTTPATATTVRFSSSSGGYFDVQIAAAGAAVTNQTDANTFASRLNAAFSTLNFTQNRFTSSYTPAGQLALSSVEFNLSDFSNVQLDSVQAVAAPGAGLDATIEFTINGNVFRTNGLGDKVAAYENIRLTSVADSTQYVTFRNGSTELDLSTQSSADTIETNLQNAFALGVDKSSIDFQLGNDSADKIQIRISDVRSNALFGTGSFGIGSQAAAVAASAVLENALTKLGTVNAAVGSYQSRINFASNTIESSILATDEARAELADTDYATEATIFAATLVRQQAAVSVLAQVNSISSSLLGLLEPAR